MTSSPIDNDVHELKLGNSFDAHQKTGFHTIRYDFKPASVDTNKEACVEVGKGNQVTVTVPHVEGSGSLHTVFKGNKQPLTKECVLIIDHKTGTYTLEKVTSKITVKKTRLEGSSKAMQHITGRETPVDKKLSKVSSSKSNTKPEASSNSPEGEAYSITPIHSDVSKDDVALVGDITDTSSDEEEEEQSKPPPPSFKQSPKSKQPAKFEVLDNDLALSSSGSDSD